MSKQKKDYSVPIFVSICAVITIVFILLISGGTASSNNNDSSNGTTTTISNIDDKQVIEISAKFGYNPSVIQAKAGIPTILRVKTNNTFDCSSSFRIPKLNISKSLPTSGTTDFDIGTQASGSQVLGVCGMGMYSLKIDFS